MPSIAFPDHKSFLCKLEHISQLIRAGFLNRALNCKDPVSANAQAPDVPLANLIYDAIEFFQDDSESYNTTKLVVQPTTYSFKPFSN